MKSNYTLHYQSLTGKSEKLIEDPLKYSINSK
jgi:hypothetical protein